MSGVLGIIPARGGSKGIPGKNLALVGGRPLIAWTFDAALASRRLTRVHGEVRKRVEAFLIGEQGWTKQETERALADAATHLDTDLRRMLAGAETGARERREELYE